MFIVCTSFVNQLILPIALETITNYAFYNCTSLSITNWIATSIKHINDHVFFVSEITHITLPETLISITEVQTPTFKYCTILTTTSLSRETTSTSTAHPLKALCKMHLSTTLASKLFIFL